MNENESDAYVVPAITTSDSTAHALENEGNIVESNVMTLDNNEPLNETEISSDNSQEPRDTVNHLNSGILTIDLSY